MSKETVETGVPQEAPKKVNRRGISNSTRSASQRKYHVSMVDRNTKMFVGALMDVTVTYSDFKDDDASQSAFRGMKVPRLSFHFASLDPNVNTRAHVYKTFTPLQPTVETIPGAKKAWMLEGSILGYIKYLLDVYYLKGRELTESEEELLSLDIDDIDENGNFQPVEAEDTIKAFDKMFFNVAAMFNTANGGKPVFLSDKGAPIGMWMKLITCYKSDNTWKHVEKNGGLAFPSFVGEGVLEIKTDRAPILNLNSATESVANIVDAKAPTALPPMPGATMIPQNGSPISASSQPISDDLPF